jgi:hypothetical protein
MRRSRIVLAAVAIAATGILIACNSPTDSNPPPLSLGRVILADGFEYGTDTLANRYNQVAWGERGFMSTTTAAAHSGTYSLTSDSAKTGIRPYSDFLIDDSIAGIEFYFMAKKAEHIPFFAAIGSSGSEWNGLKVILGIGATATDSLQYIYEWQANKPENRHTCFAPLQYNRWYKLRVECNFNDTTASYFVNDSNIQTIKTKEIYLINRFFVMRDSLGWQGSGPGGPKEYYLDDYTLYKR